VESMQIPHGFHVDSMWNAPNISTYFQVRFKKLISCRKARVGFGEGAGGF
jgi:hypothetical protein